jgi:hypothetical protein
MVTKAPGAAPAVLHTFPLHPPPVQPPQVPAALAAAPIDESAYARLLASHFTWIQARGMLSGRHVKAAAGDEAAKESKLEAFVRSHRLSYLYATVKTHKEVYGWRFIAGGCDISVSSCPTMHLACGTKEEGTTTMALRASQLRGCSCTVRHLTPDLVWSSRSTVARRLQRHRRGWSEALTARVELANKVSRHVNSVVPRWVTRDLSTTRNS